MSPKEKHRVYRHVLWSPIENDIIYHMVPAARESQDADVKPKPTPQGESNSCPIATPSIDECAAILQKEYSSFHPIRTPRDILKQWVRLQLHYDLAPAPIPTPMGELVVDFEDACTDLLKKHQTAKPSRSSDSGPRLLCEGTAQHSMIF